MTADLEKRKQIGDRFLSGSGVEFGPGTAPSHYRNVKNLTFADKRTPAEIEALFGSKIGYKVLSVEQALASFVRSADFVVAHHVIEHIANPIRALSGWLEMIRDEGNLFLSLPNEKNGCEAQRLPTPFSHVLDDYVFDRDEDHFDSKLHVPHFINQWEHFQPGGFHYSKDRNLKHYVEASLSEARRNGHDLHWHTYTLEVISAVVEAAAWFADRSVEWLHREDNEGASYLVASIGTPTAMPPFIKDEVRRLDHALSVLRRT
ncbi:methyltransferase domain-containing protein [Bradyrhizobium sp. LHD-71]|uniref:methyltransferase domain-containing protein n=1 Tax=Bradyrhizobium sp. LHD-71 TaxID=3072141 RepID=UPI00280E5153|nr:methyltransferase domain-containing protein [Bradyrhizobium sp. LHD-71]MDQ8728355.1 methyltransferase domain-containing protein [Bradyrhizobium sp. LHD-71]